jgi:hypothetical protein
MGMPTDYNSIRREGRKLFVSVMKKEIKAIDMHPGTFIEDRKGQHLLIYFGITVPSYIKQYDVTPEFADSWI